MTGGMPSHCRLCWMRMGNITSRIDHQAYCNENTTQATPLISQSVGCKGRIHGLCKTPLELHGLSRQDSKFYFDCRAILNCIRAVNGIYSSAYSRSGTPTKLGTQNSLLIPGRIQHVEVALHEVKCGLEWNGRGCDINWLTMYSKDDPQHQLIHAKGLTSRFIYRKVITAAPSTGRR